MYRSLAVRVTRRVIIIIIDYFDTMDDAIKYAKIRFEDGLYSIQKVNETPVSLGYIGSFLNA